MLAGALSDREIQCTEQLTGELHKSAILSFVMGLRSKARALVEAGDCFVLLPASKFYMGFVNSHAVYLSLSVCV